MKKIIVVLLLGMYVSSPVKADNLLSLFSEVRGSVFYDFNETDLLTGGTVPVISFDKLVSLDIGVITEAEEPLTVAFAGGISVDLKTLAERLKGEYHPENKLYVGIYYARNFKLLIDHYGVNAGTKIDILK